MSRILFRQIQTGSRLLVIGNFFREVTPEASWRLAALFERNGQMQLQRFGLEASCILGVGREFIGEANVPYQSRGFQKRLVLPPVENWEEKPLGECARLAKRLALTPEVAGQRCFVFEADGLRVWLPKFELARKLFFHSAFLVRAAFEPSGLDVAFTIYKEGEDFHVHTPAKTGAPVKLLKIKEYRDHFSWLLFEQDVKRSFESIWQSINREQTASDSKYARWRFNFMPPTSLSGVSMAAQGPFDPESAELLVWEIKALQGLRFNYQGDIYFHHPLLKVSVRGEGGGFLPAATGGWAIEVDIEDEPNEAKERELVELPIEMIDFDGELITRVAYNGERASGHGRKVDNQEFPGGEEKLYGVADAVVGGVLAPGEFQQLGHESANDLYPARFNLLKDIIKDLAKDPAIKLLEQDVKPLPQLPRCGYHMMDDGQPRYYLIARFQLLSGAERYLLEIDTSDNKRPLSTRIVGFKAQVAVKECLENFLRATVRGSLRWPPAMTKFCEPLYSIHHPKESSPSETQVRMDSWKQRIKASLI